jgi:hypothetical protein
MCVWPSARAEQIIGYLPHHRKFCGTALAWTPAVPHPHQLLSSSHVDLTSQHHLGLSTYPWYAYAASALDQDFIYGLLWPELPNSLPSFSSFFNSLFTSAKEMVSKWEAGHVAHKLKFFHGSPSPQKRLTLSSMAPMAHWDRALAVPFLQPPLPLFSPNTKF